MRVLLVTSWGDQICGIAEHSKSLIEYVGKADPSIEFTPSAEALDSFRADDAGYDWVWLNYHRGLHSRWTPAAIKAKGLKARNIKLGITFHDTYGENPPDELTRELCELADAFIVHEPCVGLPNATYWRMGVPESDLQGYRTRWYTNRPILGTCGFDFPWKNYDLLAEVTEDLGWGLVICTPQMNADRQTELLRKNPHLEVYQALTTPYLISTLRDCDASAFWYTCANSGQSAAILLGIAAGKPVIANASCRQFRALATLKTGVKWTSTEAGLRWQLTSRLLTRFYPPTVALAKKDSWVGLGQRYARLLRGEQV